MKGSGEASRSREKPYYGRPVTFVISPKGKLRISRKQQIERAKEAALYLKSR